MAERVQTTKQTGEAKQDQTLHADPAAAEQADKSDLDALLDEIDAVLEENAEEFVKNYRQKGGQ
jgi:ubiquitin-like protein Pup